MRKWSFLVEVNDWANLKSIVEEEARKNVQVLGIVDFKKAIWRVIVTFYQKKDRWLKDDPSIPREDLGIDLDNLLQKVFDGLGPIVGYREDWTGRREHGGVLDATIVETSAKKVNSGSDKEFVGVEIELLHVSQAEKR